MPRIFVGAVLTVTNDGDEGGERISTPPCVAQSLFLSGKDKKFVWLGLWVVPHFGVGFLASLLPAAEFGALDWWRQGAKIRPSHWICGIGCQTLLLCQICAVKFCRRGLHLELVTLLCQPQIMSYRQLYRVRLANCRSWSFLYFKVAYSVRSETICWSEGFFLCFSRVYVRNRHHSPRFQC